MRKQVIAFGIAAVVALGTSACGPDNLQACQEYNQALAQCDADAPGEPCRKAMNAYPCDLTPYYGCMRANLECDDEGVAKPADAICLRKLTCS